MFFHAKGRRLPPVDVVTLFTGAFPRAVVKLPLVRIWCVAVLASVKRNLFLEVIIQMAGLAGHLGVLAEQRVLGLGVIKVIGWQHDLPSVGCMAGLARFFKLAAVWIHVAVDAVGKLHVLVPYRPARCIGLVALIAGHLAVQSGQRIPRLRVIKLAFLAIFQVSTLWHLVHSLPSDPLCGSAWQGVQAGDCPKKDLAGSLYLISALRLGSMCAGV